jgi:hypothetical protein
MFRASLKRWIDAPFVTGWLALLCVIAAVALPTIARAAVNGVVTGCEFTPYLPFVLISAILLGWKEAVAVAMVSVALLGGLFFGSPHAIYQGTCFQTAAGIFLASSALILGIVILVRRIISGLLGRPDTALGGGILSLDDGEVWLSRHGQGPPVCLGSQSTVSEMMKDFLAQEELGKRLNRRCE